MEQETSATYKFYENYKNKFYRDILTGKTLRWHDLFTRCLADVLPEKLKSKRLNLSRFELSRVFNRANTLIRENALIVEPKPEEHGV